MNRDYLYGTTFGLLASAIILLAFRGGAHLILVWPAVSFAIVAIAYLTNDVSWFGKRSNGSRHWLATATLFPYVALLYCVWLAQISLVRAQPIHYVGQSLAVARKLRTNELPADVEYVCDLTCEFIDPKSFREKPGYRCHPILDAGACAAADLVELARSLPASNSKILLIHCANGHGRTGMFAAVWLLTHRLVTDVDDAIALLRSARPGIALRTRQRQVVAEASSLIQSIEKPLIANDRDQE